MRTTSAIVAVAVWLLGGAGSAEAKSLPEACKILTAAKIKALLGVDFAEGTSAPSYTGGSTCKFTGLGKTPGRLILQIGDKKYASARSAYGGKIVDVAGIADAAFYQVPTSGITGATLDKGGNSNAVVIKGTTHALLTIYSPDKYNRAQVAALLTWVAGQL